MMPFRSILLSLVLVILSACHKQRNCVCHNSGGGNEVAFTTRSSYAKAKQQCEDYYIKNFGSIPMNESHCEVED